MRHHLITVLAIAGGGVAAAPAGAAADAAERVRVCSESLELNREPHQGWDGVLREGESFAVRKLSDSGKYAYGLAYGNINRVGWVLASGLCSPQSARAAVAARLLDDRVGTVVPRLDVTDVPNGTVVGTLEPPQTFRVSKLSESGKYAYGVAYGDVDRPGWVLTGGLVGGNPA